MKLETKDQFRAITIIPARMGSSRFPGKPLAKILDKPMIQHVYEGCIGAKNIETTLVATCDAEIYEFVSSIGGNVVMTSRSHERASDRCAEAIDIFEQANNKKFDFVVMVQGDEPMVKADMIDAALAPLILDSDINVSNMVASLTSDDLTNPNVIKVVTNRLGDAMYMSRKDIPAFAEQEGYGMSGKQVCIIPFRREFLATYSSLAPTPLEVIESIDMLRVLEHGLNVRMIPTALKTHPVDTKEDVAKVIELMRANDSAIE